MKRKFKKIENNTPENLKKILKIVGKSLKPSECYDLSSYDQ
jgi:hypothetical protein